MLAVLNRPIVTDYVPVARPPWVFLALLVGLVAFLLPRDVLPTAALVSAAVVLAAALANWVWSRFVPRDGPPEDDSNHPSHGEPTCLAA